MFYLHSSLHPPDALGDGYQEQFYFAHKENDGPESPSNFPKVTQLGSIRATIQSLVFL